MLLSHCETPVVGFVTKPPSLPFPAFQRLLLTHVGTAAMKQQNSQPPQFFSPAASVARRLRGVAKETKEQFYTRSIS